MGIIVAIGGGEMRKLKTFAIDEYIVKITDKQNPRTLFIPTASYEAQGYIDLFNEIYGQKLGCIVDTLLLLNEKLTDAEIKEKILSADIIYVGGGDTVKMMETWKKFRVDEYLKQAYEKGIILSGLSAGSICWFKYGHSDSNSFRNNEGWWDYTRVDGLELINAVHCPHYNQDGREGFDEMMLVQDEVGIALEDNCAVVIKDNNFKILKSDEKANAYKIFNIEGKVYKELIENYEFVSIDKLLDK